MASLATLADLKALPSVTVTDDTLGQRMLDAAADAIRDAAGSSISQDTSTITLDGVGGTRLDLPGQPVTDVSSVQVDGVAVTDWRLVQGSLWRACGWGCSWRPVTVTVTYTHGYQTVPADIALLCCELAAAALNAATDGIESKAGLLYEAVDDYRVGYQQGDQSQASVVEIPDRTAAMLRGRFGVSTFVVGAWE